MTRALERHRLGECRVIPVIVLPVDWISSPFGKLQALPRDGKPVTAWATEDEAWADVARGVKLVCEQLLAAGANRITRYERPIVERDASQTFVLYEVFLKSGVPSVTFVEPEQFTSLILSLAQPGRGVVIEGPTGIGKTTALRKALERIGFQPDAHVDRGGQITMLGYEN
jgi:hypothetical protein